MQNKHWITILLPLLCAVATAQDSNFRVVGASATPGLPVECRIKFDHTSDCEAFSLGVSHDPSLLSISNLQRGFYLEGANLGGVSPDFLMLETTLLSGSGFVVGCLFDLSPPIVDLIAGFDQEILICTYQVLPTASAGDTPLQFSADLHSPPVTMLVVMDGLEFTPTWEDGAVSILADCNLNGTADGDDVANGTSEDCDQDGVPDECGYSPGQSDCNQDGIPDICELDCNFDGVPDSCQTALDCDLDGVLDSCELIAGTDSDCNGNGFPDSCEIGQGVANDCDGDGVLDSCELAAGTDQDCDFDGIPDSCALAQGLVSDCDGDGVLDSCELASGTALDCDADGLPDSCALAQGIVIDCDADGFIDSCEIAAGTESDCNLNGVPDLCDLSQGTAVDCDGSGILDSCEVASGSVADCNVNGIPDACDVSQGTAFDCDGSGVLDSCELASGALSDCDQDGLVDICEIADGLHEDCDFDSVPDDCAIAMALVEDCDLNGVPDSCEIAAGGDQNQNGVLDVCEDVQFRRGDCNGSGLFNIADAIITLNYLFGLPAEVTCQDACDSNDDSNIDIADAVFVLGALFGGGPLPAQPFPDCGEDPTLDTTECTFYEASCP